NAYVDPRSGLIVAVGNSQNIPKELVNGMVPVTFQVRIPTVEQIRNRRGYDAIDNIYGLDKNTNPDARASIEKLKGQRISQSYDGNSRLVNDPRVPSVPQRAPVVEAPKAAAAPVRDWTNFQASLPQAKIDLNQIPTSVNEVLLI